VTGEGAAFRNLEDCAEDYRARYLADGDDSPSSVDGIQAARSLYWALGIDPTKTRPSSEALLRRALKSKPLYSVNTLVDVCNWCSLDFLLPIGLYDRAKIQGSVTLRQGQEGESYEGIGKPPVSVEGRYVLADDAGPFGSPTSDSLRTSVTEGTTETLMTIFAPADYPLDRLNSHGEAAAARIREFCGGYTTRIEVIEATKPPDPSTA
jgi:DNA/RNA-binding domain of Phe-tRNA-synthetase-like protein